MPAKSAPDYRTVLYEQFGNSWRLAPEESLFEYPPGMRASDVQDFRPPDSVASVASLDEATRKKARGICIAAGLRSQPMLDNCIIDVGTTGQERFASAAADAASTSGRRRFTAELSGSGAQVVDRFFAKANEKYFFQTLDLTGSLDLSSWELVAPNGERVFRRCLRCNQPGAFQLPVTGVYTSRVVVSGQESGRVLAMRHRVPKQQVFDIETTTEIATGHPAPGAGQIEEAGGEDIYRFRGTGGDKIRIVLKERDRTLHLGEWSLRSPSGELVFGRILPGPPALPVDVELPETGVYTLGVTGGSNWPALDVAGYGAYTISLQERE